MAAEVDHHKMVGRHRMREDRRHTPVAHHLTRARRRMRVLHHTQAGADVEGGSFEKLLSTGNRYLICKVAAVECGECVEFQVSGIMCQVMWVRWMLRRLVDLCRLL